MTTPLYFDPRFAPHLVAELPARRKTQTYRKAASYPDLRAGRMLEIRLAGEEHVIGQAMITGLTAGVLRLDVNQKEDGAKIATIVWDGEHGKYTLTNGQIWHDGFEDAEEFFEFFNEHGCLTHNPAEPVPLVCISFALMHPVQARRDYLNLIS